VRRLVLFALLAVAAILIMALGGARDEGDYLASQISDAAQRLAVSNDDQIILRYAPRSGQDQTYWVSVGVGPRCDNPPCSSDGKSWLTVHTEGRDGGVSYAYQRYAAVPRPLKVTRRGAPVEITLRKVDGEIQIVDLR
jgi:hypothetical protein